MTRPARYSPPCDLAYAESVVDPYPARSSLWIDVDARQHAAVTAYGGPGWCKSLALSASSGGTTTEYHYIWTIGVGAVALGVRVTGTGTLTITTPADATGTVITWYDVLSPRWIWTAEQPGTVGADALTVRASPARTWEAELATCQLVAGSGADADVWALVVSPLHRDL